MKGLDLTAEITALRDQAIQPRELAKLFAMVEGMPEHYVHLFNRCSTYKQIYEVLDGLADINI